MYPCGHWLHVTKSHSIRKEVAPAARRLFTASAASRLSLPLLPAAAAAAVAIVAAVSCCSRLRDVAGRLDERRKPFFIGVLLIMEAATAATVSAMERTTAATTSPTTFSPPALNSRPESPRARA